MFPGDIVSIVEIADSPDSYGYIRAINDQKKSFRLDKNLKFPVVQDLKTSIKNRELTYLICIEEGIDTHQPPILTLNNFENILIDYYKNFSKKSQNINDLIIKWRSAAEKPESIKFFKPQNVLDRKQEKIEWLFANKDDKWIIPISCSKYCNATDESSADYCFTAAPQFESPFTYPGCSKMDNEMPTILNVKLRIDNILKNTLFKIYGFLRPENHHYHLWKHVISDTPSAIETAENIFFNVKEKTFWENEYGHVDNNGKEFLGCTENDKYTACIPCDPMHFASINNSIDKIKNYYLKHSVTFFKNAPTKSLRYVGRGYPEEWHMVEISCIKKNIKLETPEGKTITVTQKLRMCGVCFNLNDEIPTIHLYYRTFLFDGRPFIWTEKEARRFRRYEYGIIEGIADV